jgi:hypothetical protein
MHVRVQFGYAAITTLQTYLGIHVKDIDNATDDIK